MHMFYTNFIFEYAIKLSEFRKVKHQNNFNFFQTQWFDFMRKVTMHNYWLCPSL